MHMSGFADRLATIKGKQEAATQSKAEAEQAVEAAKLGREVKKSELITVRDAVALEFSEAEETAKEAESAIAQADAFATEQGESLDVEAKAEIDALKSEAAEVQAKFVELKTALANLNAEIAELEGTVETTVAEIGEESVSAEVGEEPVAETPANKTEALTVESDRLPGVNIDAIFDQQMPDEIRRNWRKDKIAELINLEGFKYGSLLEAAGIEAPYTGEKTGIELIKNVQAELWEKRVAKLKPEFRAVCQGEYARTTVQSLFRMTKTTLDAWATMIPKNQEKNEQQIKELEAVPEKDRDDSWTRKMRTTEEKLTNNKNSQVCLEALKKMPGFLELTDRCSRGDKAAATELEQLLSE